MRNTTTLLTACLLLGLFASDASAEFETYDADQDSRISAEEYRALGDERFSAYDKDGDGTVSAAEFHDTEYGAYDQDGDRFWNPTEYTVYQENEALFE